MRLCLPLSSDLEHHAALGNNGERYAGDEIRRTLLRDYVRFWVPRDPGVETPGLHSRRCYASLSKFVRPGNGGRIDRATTDRINRVVPDRVGRVIEYYSRNHLARRFNAGIMRLLKEI